MATWFVSRHQGAIEWAKRRGLAVDFWVTHLDSFQVIAGDTVMGTMPVHIASIVCRRGARYFHLTLDLPNAWRGRELSTDELEAAGARLEAFDVKPMGEQ